MRFAFEERLINGPFDDPGLFIQFAASRRAILFDLGDITTLSPRDIHKIRHVFVTHTHMDHFSGFDRLLRHLLGYEKKLHIFGPKGILNNVAGKLSGYSWNLISDCSQILDLKVTEICQDGMTTRNFLSKNRFEPNRPSRKTPFSGSLLSEPKFSLGAAILDHGIPCLGFRLEERDHIHILKEGLEGLGLEKGPWLTAFKRSLANSADENATFEIPAEYASNMVNIRFKLKELADKITMVTPGRKIAYVADAGYTRTNVSRIQSLAQDVDKLYIESAFLEEDAGIASAKYHLTARQAGEMAALAGARKLETFHFSTRYMNRAQLLIDQANDAWKAKKTGSSPRIGH